MRFFAKTTVGLFAATLSLCAVANADPLISAFIGTQTATSKTAYFVLDFNDAGSTPETYALGWYYEGAKKADDFPLALAQSLTGAGGFKEVHGDDPNFGRFFTTFGYNGREISGASNPNGYWSFWVGFDGASWTSSDVGASSTLLGNTPLDPPVTGLQAASWTGWRWVNDYRTDSAAAPRTPQQATVVPEGGTLVLFTLGLMSAGVVVRRGRNIKL